MNTAQIGNFIREPQNLTKAQVQDFENLCQTYPYSGLLHLLLLKALGNSKSVDFEQNLKMHAIKVPNRALLYNLIHDEAPDAPFVDEPKVATTLPEITTAVPIVEDTIDVSGYKALELIKNAEQGTLEKEAPLIIQIESSSDQVSSEALDSGGLNETEAPAKEATQIDNIRTTELPTFSIDIAERIADLGIQENEQEQETVDRKYTLDEVPWLDNTITFEGFFDEQNENSASNNQDEAPAKEASNIDAQPRIEEFIKEPVFEKNPIVETSSAKSFYDWLNKKTQIDAVESVKRDERINLASTSQVSINDPHVDAENPKVKVQDLVNKFIELEPKISRPKATFFSPTKSAKESVSDEGIPVSETLAKIYELQGNYPKAIAVYEKLKELLPNKLSEFDNKIANIRYKYDL
jgi:hypothetical protein